MSTLSPPFRQYRSSGTKGNCSLLTTDVRLPASANHRQNVRYRAPQTATAAVLLPRHPTTQHFPTLNCAYWKKAVAPNAPVLDLGLRNLRASRKFHRAPPPPTEQTHPKALLHWRHFYHSKTLARTTIHAEYRQSFQSPPLHPPLPDRPRALKLAPNDRFRKLN